MMLLGSILRRRSSFWSSLNYSTLTRTTPPYRDPLVLRIVPLGNPRVSIAPVLDQWVEEGQSVTNSQLKELIRTLRKQRRFTHALQAFEWMSDKRNNKLSPVEIAIHMDLITKVQGIEEAEKYFDSIPEFLRLPQVHGALLNCYVEKRSSHKAEIVMQKIRESGIPSTLDCNNMLRLYVKMNEFEKIGAFVQEMEERGINPDKYTYNLQLNAFAASSDLESMEKLLMKMEIDPLITIEWYSYVQAAKGYLKANLTDKASQMLRKAESCVNFQTRKAAYETLLTLHASAGNKDDVYRVWKLYKNFGRVYSKGCLIMIRSLLRLGDIDGAEKIFYDWASRGNNSDHRIPNCMVHTYCKKGLLDKAEAFVNNLIESGKETQGGTWGILATGYRFENQMEKAVEMLKKALLATGSQPYFPNRKTLDACHEYLKEKGDAEGLEELLGLLRQRFQVDSGDYSELVERILNNGDPSSSESDQDDQV